LTRPATSGHFLRSGRHKVDPYAIPRRFSGGRDLTDNSSIKAVWCGDPTAPITFYLPSYRLVFLIVGFDHSLSANSLNPTYRAYSPINITPKFPNVKGWNENFEDFGIFARESGHGRIHDRRDKPGVRSHFPILRIENQDLTQPRLFFCRGGSRTAPTLIADGSEHASFRHWRTRSMPPLDEKRGQVRQLTDLTPTRSPPALVVGEALKFSP
jgi:hypothetical protein